MQNYPNASMLLCLSSGIWKELFLTNLKCHPRHRTDGLFTEIFFFKFEV